MKTNSLKQRIARAFVLLALVLAGFFTLVSYISVEVIEAQVIDARLDKIATSVIEHHRKKANVDTPPDVSFFVNESIPSELKQLAPGTYELFLDDRKVLALVRAEGNNRFAIIEEVSEFEHTEFIIFMALGVASVSSLLLAVVLGLSTAKHIIAPIAELAEAVGRADSAVKLPSLQAEDEIGVLARAFAKRTDDLQQFLVRERLFSGDVSHELRTPLTIMLGAAEVLKVQLAGQPALLAVAERVRRVAAETSERVSALLFLSRSPDLLDAPLTSLNPLIQQEMDRCQILLAGKPVQFRMACSVQASVEARPELAGIVIGNLLRNACQHTDQGIVQIQLEKNRLVIEDNGPGIPATVRARLFERFVQGDKDSPEGTGLGLSIVKRVTEQIGWDISLEIPESGGSRFVLVFPSPSIGANPIEKN